MGKEENGKTHTGERREKRPNGDIYVYDRVTAYNKETRKTYTVSQKLRGKIKAGTQGLFLPDQRRERVKKPLSVRSVSIPG